MKSKINDRIRRLLADLPSSVRRRAEAAYRLFKDNPHHKSLQFKVIDEKRNLYSVRIGRSYRALGIMKENHEIVWFWIGSHAEYDTLIR